MDIIFFLVPISVLLLGIVIWLFCWAIKSEQYDDLDKPAHEIILDDARDYPKIYSVGSGEKDE